MPFPPFFDGIPCRCHPADLPLGIACAPDEQCDGSVRRGSIIAQRIWT
jgi:hypothetical protein